MMSTLLSRANPVAAAAKPEQEFRKEITTGMSTPPTGTTSKTPKTDATAIKLQKATVESTPVTSQAAKARDNKQQYSV